jgi:mannose-6-phosphate isomerase-like protein (cupin superfamily)
MMIFNFNLSIISYYFLLFLIILIIFDIFLNNFGDDESREHIFNYNNKNIYNIFIISIFMREYYLENIETETRNNTNFRKVLYTNTNQQLVLMCIKPNQDIGNEIHNDVDQFIRIEKGIGKAIINNNEYLLNDGSIVMIPRGLEHNIINTGNDDLKLYSIYSPPEHKNYTINRIKPNNKTNKTNKINKNKKSNSKINSKKKSKKNKKEI